MFQLDDLVAVMTTSSCRKSCLGHGHTMAPSLSHGVTTASVAVCITLRSLAWVTVSSVFCSTVGDGTHQSADGTSLPLAPTPLPVS